MTDDHRTSCSRLAPFLRGLSWQEACHRLGEKDTFVVINPYLKRVNCTLTHASPSSAGEAQDKAARKGAKNDQEDGEGGNDEQQERTYDSIQVRSSPT